MARCSTSVELSDYKKAEVRADILNKKALRYDDCVASGCPAAVLHAGVQDIYGIYFKFFDKSCLMYWIFSVCVLQVEGSQPIIKLDKELLTSHT